MELNLKKPLVFFDLETTGLNITSDKIVEISYIKVFPNGTEESKTLRVNPGMHIPEQATAVHHITDDDVKDCPTFKQVARSLASVFEGSDVAGFNSNRFDIPMLQEEFLNAGVDFDFSKRKFVDVQTIWLVVYDIGVCSQSIKHGLGDIPACTIGTVKTNLNPLKGVDA